MSELHMTEAIRLAQEGMEQGEGGPFGAVIVREQEVVGRGFNRVLGLTDPTAHAEVQAIRDASARLGRFDLSGCRIYSSCEPCPMCMAAIHWARLDELIFAAGREDAAAIGFDDALIAERLGQGQPEQGLPRRRLMQDEAAQLMKRWLDKSDREPY